METDDTVEYYMEWIKRMTDRYWIHFGALAECERGLVNHLQEIIREKDALKAQKAKNTLASYSNILDVCRELSGDSMLWSLKSNLEEIDKLLRVSQESEAPINMSLSEANWSMRQTIIGRIRLVPTNPNVKLLVSLRGGYFGTMIYLMDTRPSVGELFDWPDKKSVIVSGGGGADSEEMIYALSGRIPYINNAGRYFSDLVRLEGKLVKLLPSSPTRIEHSEVAAGSWLLPKEIESCQPIEYINSVMTHPKIREMAYVYLAWCVEGSEAGAEILEQLKPLMSTEGYQHYTSEARLILRKDYPDGYKLQKGNEFIRALARFAAARERRDFDYALEIAKAFPCEPLAKILTTVLSEDKRIA